MDGDLKSVGFFFLQKGILLSFWHDIPCPVQLAIVTVF